MSSIPSFPSWLGTLFGHSEIKVQRLLKNKLALHFLVAWSLFESKCFGGFAKAEKIKTYANDTHSSIDLQALNESTEHFHKRYQCPTLFRNLMHQQQNQHLENVLQQSFSDVSGENRLYVLVFVIYRYRNNIFHGNKGVRSWLQYQEQIQHCIRAMQVMVSHAEFRTPTINASAA